MKKYYFLITFVLFISSLYAQQWTQKNNFSGPARFTATGFTNNGYGYICAGKSNNANQYSDLWRYDVINDSWTLKNNFPGAVRTALISFTIDTLSYVGMGYDNALNTSYKDMYVYNPTSDSWQQLTNYPGTLSRGSRAVSLNGKGYVLGGGANNGTTNHSNEIWEYYPVSDTWVQRPNHQFAARAFAVAFVIDSLIYYGLGHNLQTSFQDLWAFDPSTNIWVQKSTFPGAGRFNASVFVINGKAIVGGGQIIGGTRYSDYYLYDPIADSWSVLPTNPALKRSNSSYFSIGSKGYLFTGKDSMGAPLGDVWQYTDTTLITGVLETENLSTQLKVYPNPTNGMIKFSDVAGQFSSVNVYDSNGKLLLSNRVTLSGNVYELDLSAMKNGTYFYQLVGSDSEKITGKILLKK